MPIEPAGCRWRGLVRLAELEGRIREPGTNSVVRRGAGNCRRRGLHAQTLYGREKRGTCQKQLALPSIESGLWVQNRVLNSWYCVAKHVKYGLFARSKDKQFVA